MTKSRGVVRALDLRNQRFGRLTVIDRTTGRGKHSDVCWICSCDCGTNTVVRTRHLRSGSILSCGCLNRELAGARVRKHGLSSRPECSALRNALDRCSNPDNRSYKHYGQRGIEYRLPEDIGEATTLLILAIGPRPAGLTLDRIDNNGHYEIGNLRWATHSEQNRNQRRRQKAAAK